MKTKFRRIISLLLVFTVVFSSTVLSSSAKNAETEVNRDTVLVLDISGSMDGTPMTVMKQAAKKFCEAVLSASGNNRVAIVAFESSYYVLDFTDDFSTLESYINSLSAGGGTYLYDACNKAEDLLVKSKAEIKNMVILADGLPEHGQSVSTGKYTSSDSYYYDHANAIYSLVKSFDQLYSIYTLGFFHSLSGSTLSFARRFMNDLQNSGYYDVTNVDDLEFTFGEIAGDIVNNQIEYYVKHDDEKYSKVNLKAVLADSSFSDDSAVYNHDLAVLCSQFVMVGYTSPNGPDDDAKGYLSKNTVMKNALKSLGFSEESSVVNLNNMNETQVNYFIAHKEIKVDGEEFTLIFTGFIGSYYPQWYNNFNPGTGKTHEGFNSAKNFVSGELDKYINKNNLKNDNIKLLITGHSRGAATANLLAAEQIKTEKYTSKENIYAYTFATPNPTSLSERSQERFKRIFNIVNPEDFVTKVMPAEWGYGKYGTVITLPSKTNSSDYKAYLSKMEPYFTILSAGRDYQPYPLGESEVRAIVNVFTRTVDDVNDFYEPGFRRLDMVYTSPYKYFQNAICPLVGEKDTNAKKISALLLLSSSSEALFTSSPYHEFSKFFLLHAVLTNLEKMTPDVLEIVLPVLYPVLTRLSLSLQMGTNCFEDAHCAETYCAYMLAMGDTMCSLTPRKSVVININCPVDGEIIDKSTGEVVARIVDNTVDETIESKENSIVASVDGDSKTFWLPSDGDYEIRLTGNDRGTMDCTVSEIDSDLGETSRINFFDVDIKDGLKLTGEMDGETFVLEKFELEYESGKKLSPTEQIDGQNEKVTVYTEAIGNGFVSPTMSVTRGDYVTVSAIAEDGNSYFVEWCDLDTGETLSCDAEYSFVAKEDINLGAYFYTNEFFIFEPSTYNINYGDILVLEAYKGDLSEGAQLIWYTEGNSVDAWSYWDDDSIDYVEGIASGYSTISVEVVDEYGNPLLDGEGNPYYDEITVYCNGSFIMKLISFFKNLFGIDRYVY